MQQKIVQKSIKKKLRSELPLYLGIFAQHPHPAKHKLMHHVMHSAKLLLEKYPEDQNLQMLLADLTLQQKAYKFPPSLHITSLYIGGDKNLTETDYYKNFTVGLEQHIKVHAIAISPQNIIACVVSRDDYQIPIQNQFPHMTTLTGSWQPVDSNLLLQTLFDVEMPLHQVYPELFKNTESDQVWRTMIDAKGSVGIPAYVVQLKEKFNIEAETQYG